MEPTPAKPTRVPATVRGAAAQADMDTVIRANVRDAVDRQMAMDPNPTPMTPNSRFATTATTRPRESRAP